MSKILDLAKSFQESSETEVQNTSEIVKNVIKQHENDLREQLKNANRNIEKSIKEEQNKLIKKTTQMYKLPMIIATSLLLIILVVMLVLGWMAQKNYQEMTSWKHSAETYKEQSKNIKIANCTLADNQVKPCIMLDEKYKDKSWEGGYKIIKVD